MSNDASAPQRQCPPGMPSSDIDPWSDEVLADPHPAFRALRDQGPVVWLNRHGMAAFGRGAHLCVGHNLAKLEGRSVLAALADRVRRFELAGDPEWTINNTLHGLGTLPLRAVSV